LFAGAQRKLLKVLAEHDDLDGIWCYGMRRWRDREGAFRRKSQTDLEPTKDAHRFFSIPQSEGRWYLEHAHQVKNIWVPYGE